MNDLRQEINKIIESELLIDAVLSDLRNKCGQGYKKVVIKPFISKQKLYNQFSFYYEKKVLHENYTKEETADRLIELIENEFKQAVFFMQNEDIQVLINKKGKAGILRKKPTKQVQALEHNRNKNYLLEEGEPIDFLVELGVMNKDGKVLTKKYDKFKQINRFLEMIKDVVPSLNTSREINIVDFGCGKSYLTFVMYYYLRNVLNLSVNIVGLDLKEDVIAECNSLAERLGWDKLRFAVGDISGYIPNGKIDMVVTLHACDIATDYALEKAVKWEADVILSVPCCQHELNNQLKNETLKPMLKYGIIKERFAALATDAIRADILEIKGYKVQILEFIDMEHTPKNILIRAIKDKNRDTKRELEEYEHLKDFLGVEPTLGTLLF